MTSPTRPLFTALTFVAAITAQKIEGKPIEIGRLHTVHSKILDEDRAVSIYTPDSMGAKGERYPVVYLLDGPAHFHHTTGVVQFLARNGRMPEAIVVGVGNTDRTRDLTPFLSAEMDDEPRGGGADKFLSFLCDELSPWIEERYPTRPLRILIGHSFGGLFGVHALTKRPGFYRGIIAISPSMQWAEQKSVDAFEHWLQAANKTDFEAGIYMTVGNEGIGLLGGTMKISGMLSEMAPKGLRWKFTHMPTETHGSVPHRSTYDGFEWLFDGWTLQDPLAAFDAGGWPAIEQHYQRVRQRFGYEPEVPAGAAMALVFAMFGPNRHRDAVDLLAKLDPERYRMPPIVFEMLGRELEKRSDKAGQVAAVTEGLRRSPGHPGLRKIASELGVELPAMPDPKKGVAVPKELLARYTGSYFVKPAGGPMAVRVVDGVLQVKLPGADDHESAIARSNASFTVPSTGMLLTFSTVGDGPSQSVTVAFGDQKFVCKREN